MRLELSDEDLTRVALASEVDLLSVDLIRDVDEEDVEEVVRDMVWLEDYLHFILLISWDGTLAWD